MAFEFYRVASVWYWRLVARNGALVARCAGGYSSRGSVRRAIHRIDIRAAHVREVAR